MSGLLNGCGKEEKSNPQITQINADLKMSYERTGDRSIDYADYTD
jgi:dihydroneopterin aldolase